MRDPVLRLFWKITPKKSVSRLIGNIAKKRFSRHFIPFYIKKFQIDLHSVKKPVDQFDTLLDFFVRELQPDARPIDTDPSKVVSPVDGVITEMGSIEAGTMIQAKGVSYQLQELLADEQDYVTFLNGEFMTIYLSPRDYHRIHSPLAGEVNLLTYVPGQLYPVNELGVRLFPGLFAQNERVISYLQHPMGKVAVVKVGATNVGSIRVTFDQQLATNHGKRRQLEKKCYPESIHLQKGEELGRFEFGSTVILIFEPNMIRWLPTMQQGKLLQMGQPIAEMIQRKKD